ncbi:EamA family transporter [Actinomycetospora soli]|uniref:EamA family transporter n=1 Tax=Actinomycetospora soli TaxID=2893887 RepID=UPI001E61CEA3|nr:EamA family transporter [Actinomycetospora soli]MCD2186550.1 EamA family transporter [Actinomycetospora soli]
MARTRVVPALVLLWLCWGSSFPAMRVVVESLPPLTTSGAVFLTAGVVLAVVHARDLRRAPLLALRRAALVGACLLGAQGLAVVAVVRVPASTSALLAPSIPLWLVVLRAALGERVGARELACLAVGLGGVAVIVVIEAGGPGWTPWVLLVLGTSILWAAGTLVAARSVVLPAPGATTAVQLVTGGALVLTAGLALDPAPPGVGNASSWAAVAVLLVVDSLGGFALFTWLLRHAPVSVVGTYAYAVPVVAYLAGVLVLGEPFHPVVLVGAALVLGAVALQVRQHALAGPHDRAGDLRRGA